MPVQTGSNTPIAINDTEPLLQKEAFPSGEEPSIYYCLPSQSPFHRITLPSALRTKKEPEIVEIVVPVTRSPIKQCKYCDKSDNDNEMIAPCKCTGDCSWVHRKCLEEWRGFCPKIESFSRCEICLQHYVLDKVEDPSPFIKNYEKRMFRDALIFIFTLLLLFGMALSISIIVNIYSSPASKPFWSTYVGIVLINILIATAFLVALLLILGFFIIIIRCCCCTTFRDDDIPDELVLPRLSILSRRCGYLYLLCCFLSATNPEKSASDEQNGLITAVEGCGGRVGRSGPNEGCTDEQRACIIICVFSVWCFAIGAIILVLFGIVLAFLSLGVFIGTITNRHQLIQWHKAMAQIYPARDLSVSHSLLDL